jgi:hypothetical protein
MPSTYVSAEWVEDPIMKTKTIKATGDDGSIWWVPELACDIPPWPSFLQTEAGRQFAAQSLEPKGS